MSSDNRITWARAATVDERQGQIIVSSRSLTTTGFWELNDFIVDAPSTVSTAELGKLLLDALNASEQGAEPLERGQRSTPQTKKLLKTAGVRSWQQYYTGNRRVSVDQNDRGDLIALTPMENLGRRGGLDYLEDLTIQVRKTDAQSVGEALREALERAPIYEG